MDSSSGGPRASSLTSPMHLWSWLSVIAIVFLRPTHAGALPAKVSRLLPAVADTAAVVPLWRAVRRCYPDDEAAIRAVEANRALVLPWACSKENIDGSFQVLVEVLGDRDEAVKVVTQNPGVLGCDPQRLRLSSPADIRGTAALAAAFGRLRGTPTAVILSGLLVASVLASLGADEVAEAASSVLRPAVGAIGASAFFAAAGAAVYSSTRREK